MRTALLKDKNGIFYITPEIETFLKENIEAIEKAYNKGYNQANYNWHCAGRNRAFTYFNAIFPNSLDIRNKKSLNWCIYFNTAIQTKIYELINYRKFKRE